MKIRTLLFASLAFAVLLISGCAMEPIHYIAPSYCDKIQASTVEFVAKLDPNAELSTSGAELINNCMAKSPDFCAKVLDAAVRPVSKDPKAELSPDVANLVRTCVDNQKLWTNKIIWDENHQSGSGNGGHEHQTATEGIYKE